MSGQMCGQDEDYPIAIVKRAIAKMRYPNPSIGVWYRANPLDANVCSGGDLRNVVCSIDDVICFWTFGIIMHAIYIQSLEY